MPSLPDPILVADQKRFDRSVEVLAKEPIIAVDTESNSLYAYREQVCLIQFTTSEVDYLVDPLALDDISALGAIFRDANIEKVFHAAEYDLLCLKRDYKFTFANLFDTMVAARIVGIEKVGLGNMLEEAFGLNLQKRFQKANWGMRPLSSEMLAYARMDTHYLISLRDRLKEKLKDVNRWPIAQEDFARLSQAKGTPPGPVKTNIWRLNGAWDLSSQQAAVLQELVDFRDKKAQSSNVPVFKIIGNKPLVEIAYKLPSGRRELYGINSMSEKLVRRFGKEILAVVERGKSSKGIKRPRRERVINGYPERLEALREWRKKTAIRLGVESDVILPRDLMIEIAATNPNNIGELSTILQSLPWRLERYGPQIQLALNYQ